MRSNMDFKMRLFRIDQLVHDDGPVSFETLQQALRCSAPTLKRDLRYLREVLHAPIAYSYADNGYVYQKQTKSKEDEARPRLPVNWYSPTEMYALLCALEFFERVQNEPDGLLRGEMLAMKARLLSLIQDDKNEARELKKRLRVVLPQIRQQRSPFFEIIGMALSQRKRLNIDYFTKARQTQSTREISPLRLVNYKNRWYLDAWCHASDRLKTFSLDNVRGVEALAKRCKTVPMRDVEQTLDTTYGLFSGDVPQVAVIEVDALMGVYVKDEVWHRDQELTVHADGSLVLKVPYAQETELMGQILQLGEHAKVLAPAGLRSSVKHAVAKMSALYSKETPS